MTSTPGAIPESHRDLLTSRAFAHLATVNVDGTPQSTPVWVDYDGTHVLVNSARGRRKDRNMRARAAVSLSMTDPENPYRYLEVRGRVVEVTERGADAHIDALAKRYLGMDAYPNRREGEVRVIYKILPERTSTMG